MTNHEYEASPYSTGDCCVAMVMRNGGGDQCGLPRSNRVHDDSPPVNYYAPIVTRAEYDPDKGELSFVDDTVRRIVEVRVRFEKQALRRAAIIELERLGYTVIDPEDYLARTVRAIATSQSIGSSAQDAAKIINAFLKEPK